MSYVPNFNSAGYQNPPNRFPNGQCTWYVYGRVYEYNGGLALTIASNADAGTWLTKVSDGTKHIGNDAEIPAYGIAVFPGHVVYIESVSDLWVTFSGANDSRYTNGQKVTMKKDVFRSYYGNLLGTIEL